MRQKYLKTKAGMSALETVAILAVVSIAALAAANFLKQSNSGSFGAPGLDKKLVELINKERDQAELVVIGKIVKMSKQIQENTSMGDNVQSAHGLWTLEIESIERGYYSGDKINFFVGWGSNRIMPQQFPVGIKTKYKIGDRTKVFLKHGIPGRGNDQLSYYTREAFYCMEPL